jgi:PhoH-like ATPase
MNIQFVGKKLFVLDTNVLMHDPASIFRFQEHNIFIPMVVLEELDHAKKGLSDVSRNVRQVSRFLDQLIQDANQQTINDGLPLSKIGNSLAGDHEQHGRLFFQTHQLSHLLPADLPGQIADNSILSTVLALSKEFPEVNVILVSKDINMRIKAAALQINAEDYHNDQAIDDVDLLYSGWMALETDFWEHHGSKMESWLENNMTYYRIHSPVVKQWYPNQFVYIDDDSGFEAIVKSCDGETAVLQLAIDYRTKNHSVWGICAKNREQNYALNVLLDSNIDFVTLLGTAGTGKTLLALAAGLSMTLERKAFQEIIMTRETMPMGEDIGFLPGTEEEKMAPWMGALIDNLEVLGSRSGNTDWEQSVSQNMVMNRVKIRSLNFMRGRTFLNRYLIIDEAQNLTPKQLKTLITRAGPGTKIICIGNLGQIDTPYLTGTSSGLTYVVDRFKNWENSAHITLRRGERSRLADFASENL